jgi:pimeloyl-ACP methyl ester carboxylesterase
MPQRTHESSLNLELNQFMFEPVLDFVACPDPQGTHRMAYWSWGEKSAAHLVFCVHGLTRQGRDFDLLAQALVASAKAANLPAIRVICPDVVGRGKSDWLQDSLGYQFPQYAADMAVLLQSLNSERLIERLDWVGTSMGGVIGMLMAARELPVPVRHLVLNDIGPPVSWKSILNMKSYVGEVGKFLKVQDAANAMWEISKSFGPHTSEEWLALSQNMVRRLEDGTYCLHYDPQLRVPIRALNEEQAKAGEATLWQVYDLIQCPTLLIRGAESELLSAAAALEMTQRGARAQVSTLLGVGHAPTLTHEDQIDIVRQFLGLHA